MTAGYVLDTDTCVWALRQSRPVVDRLKAISPDDLFVASMTEAELRFGVLMSRRREQNADRLEAFLQPIEIVPFDSTGAVEHARIRHELRAKPIGERDLVIAAVASAQRLTVVTSNVREFGRVEGLDVESWSP